MKIFEGIVVSADNNNTVVVEIARRVPHPLYGKLIRLSKKLKADTNQIEIVVGNKVKIQETKPYSKSKYFKVIEVIGAQGKKSNVLKKDNSEVWKNKEKAVKGKISKPKVKKEAKA